MIPVATRRFNTPRMDWNPRGPMMAMVRTAARKRQMISPRAAAITDAPLPERSSPPLAMRCPKKVDSFSKLIPRIEMLTKTDHIQTRILSPPNKCIKKRKIWSILEVFRSRCGHSAGQVPVISLAIADGSQIFTDKSAL
jgi:hypothetical protein